ncbi:MAG: hypothetical protein ACREQ5_00500 [Candidatus Dormibacteria bacterium]
MANNQISTPYDNVAVPFASTANGRSSTGVSTSPQYAAAVVTGPADAADALAANQLHAVATEIYNGATFDRQRGAQGASFTTSGGSTTAVIAAGAGTTVVKASPGRLCRITVTTAGTTGAVTFYDNAASGSGTVLFVVPGSSVTVGTIYDVQMPAAAGITAVAAASGPALTVSFI